MTGSDIKNFGDENWLEGVKLRNIGSNSALKG